MSNPTACTLGEMIGSWLFVSLLLVGALGIWSAGRAVKALQRHGAKGMHMAESLSHLILTGGGREASEREIEAKRFLREREYQLFSDPELSRHATAARFWFKSALLLTVSLMLIGLLFQTLGSARCLLPT